MLDDLDRTLELLLKQTLPGSLAAQVAVSFAMPDNQFPPSQVILPAIDLFLYDVRENRDLRSNEWLVERQSDGTALRLPPTVRVDCSYLITAWPSANAPTPDADEHRLLGAVMVALLRYPTIPQEILQGSLAGLQPPLPTAALQPGRLQSVAEFWQAMGGKPKAALNYTITIGVLPGTSIEAGPPVHDNLIQLGIKGGGAL